MESLGGYRLVRIIGSGASANVWLGHDGSASAAVKIYRPGADLSRVDAEVEALGRSSHRHVLRLNDLVVGPTGAPSLILPRLSSAGLSRLLSTRTLSLGEAVTVLAPISSAVQHLHHIGVAHRRIGAARILFDDRGAPILVGFGNADLFGEFPDETNEQVPSREVLRQSAGVKEDISGLAGLCLAVLNDGGGARVVEWLESAAEHDPATFTAQLAERLFDLARPVQIDFNVTTAEERTSASTARLDSSLRPIAPQVTATSASGRASRRKTGVRGASYNASLPKQIGQALRNTHGTLSTFVGSGIAVEFRERLVTAFRRVRKGVWIIAATAGIGLVGVVALVPQGTSGQRSTVDVSPSAPSPTVNDSHEGPVPEIDGNDPVAAGVALLAARQQCISAGSVLCLDGVDQSGAASMQADSDLIRLLQQSGATGIARDPLPDQLGSAHENTSLAVIETLGGSVLLSVTVPITGAPPQTGTLLLVRSESGWRIRDRSAVAFANN